MFKNTANLIGRKTLEKIGYNKQLCRYVPGTINAFHNTMTYLFGNVKLKVFVIFKPLSSIGTCTRGCCTIYDYNKEPNVGVVLCMTITKNQMWMLYYV